MNSIMIGSEDSSTVPSMTLAALDLEFLLLVQVKYWQCSSMGGR